MANRDARATDIDKQHLARGGAIAPAAARIAPVAARIAKAGEFGNNACRLPTVPEGKQHVSKRPT